MSTRGALAVAALAGAVTVALGVRYAGDGAAGPFDRAIAAGLRDMMGPAPALEPLADLGNAPVVGVLAVALAAVALRQQRPRVAALAVVAPLLTAAATALAKVATGRTYGEYLAYPSGHAGLVTALVLVAALLVPPGWRVLAPLIVAGVAVALVVRDYHYATDTLGGVALATAVTAAGRAAWPDRAPSRSPAGAPAARGPR